MNELDKQIAVERACRQQAKDADFARNHQQNTDLDHLFRMIEEAQSAKHDGWRSDHGPHNEVIITHDNHPVGQWSRSKAGCVFNYEDNRRAPIKAATYDEMLSTTAEIIAAGPPAPPPRDRRPCLWRSSRRDHDHAVGDRFYRRAYTRYQLRLYWKHFRYSPRLDGRRGPRMASPTQLER